jgi:cellulose synthase/poly-beta-1,6-N-acetylglucosamine synthase-like glycosyltransferase
VVVALALVEIAASFYLIGNLVKALAYRRLLRAGEDVPDPVGPPPPVAVIYLACEDVDRRALDSLARLRYGGSLHLIVHDDSRTRSGREAVEEAVQAVRAASSHPVLLLRRPERRGGKPGALNWILAETARLHEYFLLCDNDSVALADGFLPRALAHFADPGVAAVQFRNRGVVDPEDPPVIRLLAGAVDSFDVFARYAARCGLMPFLGHNAVVRTSAVLQAGGFAEGVLSDDIDLTVRLALAGRQVRYDPLIEFGERHPPSYGAFRRRCRKWAYGCMQILGRHLLPALRSRRLAAVQKLWLLDFASFYAFQSILIPYLLLAFVVGPLLGAPAPFGAQGAALAGSLVLLSILAPTLAAAEAQGRLRDWARTAWCCALVYGSSAFATARGVLEYAAGRAKEWVPTNARLPEGRLGLASLASAGYGAALIAVPCLAGPEVLLAPSSYLFIAVFLFAPLVHLHYREPAGAAARPRAGGPRASAARGRRAAAVSAALTAVAVGLALLRGSAAEAERRVEIRGDSLYVDGRRFQVRGIHYSPWPPGTGPAKGLPWPGDDVVEKDFDLLRGLHINTLLVHDAPRPVLDRASREGWMVIYTFTLNWQSIHDDVRFSRSVAEITAKVSELKDAPSLLLWSLGNEIPEWIFRELGGDFLAARLRALRDAVAAVDPLHPVTHQNWPVTRDLPLPFLEVVSFNLYPAWPREVVVRGYGEYIERDLKPIAGGRPLLITEFGMNTLETSPARQAETLGKCWEEIRRRTAGGVVFEFVDEWWKNYDNPLAPPDYWRRRHVPDDEQVHDLDPEEYYGIFTSQRTPKPAAETVRSMFAPSPRLRQAWFLAPLAALLLYTLYVFRREDRGGSG